MLATVSRRGWLFFVPLLIVSAACMEFRNKKSEPGIASVCTEIHLKVIATHDSHYEPGRFGGAVSFACLILNKALTIRTACGFFKPNQFFLQTQGAVENVFLIFGGVDRLEVVPPCPPRPEEKTIMLPTFRFRRIFFEPGILTTSLDWREARYPEGTDAVWERLHSCLGILRNRLRLVFNRHGLHQCEEN